MVQTEPPQGPSKALLGSSAPGGATEHTGPNCAREQCEFSQAKQAAADSVPTCVGKVPRGVGSNASLDVMMEVFFYVISI